MAEPRLRGLPPPPSPRVRPVPSEVRIGALSLSVPGRDSRFGRRVAERVGALVSQQCPAGLHGDLDRIALKIQARGLSEEALSQSIAKAVLAALPGTSAMRPGRRPR
jgi:hypothetical protein